MLKNIRLHVDTDEEKQRELDESLARKILEIHPKNINSFERNISSLLDKVKSPNLQNYSLFFNVHGEVNIVDYGVGRTLYGFHPQKEISEQVTRFLTHAPKISLIKSQSMAENEVTTDYTGFKSSEGYLNHMRFPAPPDQIDCLVVFGCGLGLHLIELMKSRQIKYLIVYEPELQYFQCSVLVTKWYQLFELAKQNGTSLFLQIEKDGRNLVSDITELIDFAGLEQFYIYQHYNHPVFNNLNKVLTSTCWTRIKAQGLTFDFAESYNEYVPTWTPSIDIQDYSDCDKQSLRFQQNLSALKKFFPDIFEEFRDYKSQYWLPIKNKQGQVNVVKADSMTLWYGDNPEEDCFKNYENYNRQPNKDGLVLGYKGTKLAHYLHYQFVKKTEKLLNEAEDEVGSLPKKIASIIMFGVGVGYQLETLLNEHTVEKLFICEPNRDFFYASLFAIDWKSILEQIDASDARVYLNIGDDGSHLFRDLLRQFHSIGPYILNNTYFYQSYYNASLNLAIAQLREQLQIVISMGEYFDHAYYGIEHTKEGFRRNYPILIKTPSSILTFDDKEVPVFIVGNGPSLDSSIETIKEWQEQAIVVSCGTALQALHRNGITPDFHAEIEQNRSSYDWAFYIGDLEYLKKITLISCNGVHPDTCGLYKDVLIAFKEGESSTVSAQSVLGSQQFEVLQSSFPTVSNFATDLLSVIGFNQIYLMGVDLGFVDVKHHHSKSSGYYNSNGEETYDYAEKNNTSLVVPGNFRSKVNTKHEFKISRQIIEQVTAKKPKEQTFYNCSDGAKIHGTNPLPIDNLLIVSSKEQKQETVEKLKLNVFSTKFNANYIESFNNKFSHSLLKKELSTIIKLLKADISTFSEANILIKRQKEMLFNSYKSGQSLLFYYLYGTSNYANAVFTKFLSQNGSEATSLPYGFKKTKEEWLKALTKISKLVSEDTINNFDTSAFKAVNRELLSLRLRAKKERVLVVTDCDEYRVSITEALETRFQWLTPIDILTPEEALHYLYTPTYSIYYTKPGIEQTIRGKRSTLVVYDSPEEFKVINEEISYISVLNLIDVPNFKLYMALLALKVSQSAHQCTLIIPKTADMQEAERYRNQLTWATKQNYEAYDYPMYICLYPKGKVTNDGLLSRNGSRGRRILEKLHIKHLVV